MATQKQVKVISHINYESESEVSQLCLALCNLMDCSPPGSSIHGLSRQEYWSGACNLNVSYKPSNPNTQVKLV